MFCKNCGTEQKAGQKFCPNCGTPYLIEEVGVDEGKDVSMKTPVDDKTQQPEILPKRENKTHNNYVMYAVIAVLLVVAGVMGYNSCESNEKEKVIGGSYDYGEVKALSLQQILFIAKKGMDKAETSQFFSVCGFEDSGELGQPTSKEEVCTNSFYSGANVLHNTLKEVASMDFFNSFAFIHKRENSKRPNSYEFHLSSSYADYFDMLANDLKGEVKESDTFIGRMSAEKKINGMRVRIVKDDTSKLVKYGIYDVIIYIDN